MDTVFQEELIYGDLSDGDTNTLIEDEYLLEDLSYVDLSDGDAAVISPPNQEYFTFYYGLENEDFLEDICSQISPEDIRALAKTSRNLRRILTRLWASNSFWKKKLDHHLGVGSLSGMTYRDWRYVYDIILDNNLNQLFRLNSPDMAALAISLGADPARYNNVYLKRALENRNIAMIKALLSDPNVDVGNKILLNELESLNPKSKWYQDIEDAIFSR